MSITFSTNVTDIVKGFIGITLIVLAVIFIPKVVKKFEDISSPLDKTVIEQIASNAVKISLAESKEELKNYVEELKKDNSRAIKDALDNNETIKEVGTFIANFESYVNTDPNIIKTDSGDPDGKRDLEEFIIKRRDAEGTEFPTGILRYSPNVESENRFSYQQFPLEFNAVIVGSEKDDADIRRVELWAENNFVKSSKGKKYPIKIDKENVKWAKAPLKDKKFSWNPRLSLGSSFTNDAWYPSIGASLFSYGRTDRDMDWRFLDFSLGGTNDTLYGGVTLFDYNFGNFLPMVENLFGGPNISYSADSDLKENVSYGMKFSVPF